MENKFLKITNKQEWQRLLDRVLFKTFFHSMEWEDFLESQFKWLKFERYIWQDKALLSLANVAGKKLVSHPFCEYGGPLPLVDRIDGQAFQKDLFEEFKNPFRISFHPKLLDYFKDIDFPENQRETYLLEDLAQQSEIQLWEKIDRNRHRQINKAKEQRFTIESCQKIEDLKNLYNLYAKSLRSHKTVVYPFSFFQFFFKSPGAEILLVKKNNKLIGGNLFLFYNKIIHSFLCGFDERYRNLGLHSFILWFQIKKGGKENQEIFDFGATQKTSSIRDFKTRWGSKCYPIFELKNRSEESRLKKSFLREIWRWLPLWLVKALSPYFIKHKL